MIDLGNNRKIVQDVSELPDFTNATNLYVDFETVTFEPGRGGLLPHKGDRIAGIAVTADDCPSAGAWALWCWATASDENESAFMKTFLARMLPSRDHLDREERHNDACEHVQDLIAQIQLESSDTPQPWRLASKQVRTPD